MHSLIQYNKEAYSPLDSDLSRALPKAFVLGTLGTMLSLLHDNLLLCGKPVTLQPQEIFIFCTMFGCRTRMI